MWRIWNRWFGWHYAVLISSQMDYRYLCRVRKDASGRMYINFTSTKIWFLNDNGKTDNGYTWKALTWPEK